jgi:SAM-dependent methyltransferase
MIGPSAEDYKEFYENWASRREDPVEADYNWKASVWKWDHLEKLIRRHLEPQSVLEFGCGSGEMLALARSSFPSAELVGMDLSQRMIAMAKERLGSAVVRQGSEEALEAWGPPVDLVLGIDVLEHVVDPVRLARAMGQAGRIVALKIPLERRIIRLGIRAPRVGIEHLSGHLHFWTLAESRRLLRAAGLHILDESTADPPESVRYHEAMVRQERAGRRTPIGLRRAHHSFEVALERFSCRRASRLHRLMFGSNHFVLAAAGPPRSAGRTARVGGSE